MPKPFSHLALMARIKAVLKRADMPQPVEGLPDFSIGDLAIHFQNREVTARGEPARLSPVEYRLLPILVRNAGHVVFEHALSIADLHPLRFRRLRAAEVLPSHRWSVADASAGGRWTCASTALRTRRSSP